MSQKIDLVTKIKKNVCTQIKQLSLKILTNSYWPKNMVLVVENQVKFNETKC